MFLHFVFIGQIQLPQFFALGPVQIRYYGLFMAGAVAVGYFLAQRRASRYGIEPKEVDSIVFLAVIAGFIGARFYHVLSDLPFYLHNPGLILQVWRGGLSVYGAVIGGAVAVVWHVYRHTSASQRVQRILNYLDWLTPSILIGQIIGRFGNFFNYELFGYPTGLPWKMFVPLRFRPEEFLSSANFHPLFLYEALANLIILVGLLKLYRRGVARFGGPPLGAQAVAEHPMGTNRDRTPSPPGALFFGYVFLYNIVRFLLEFLRIDSVMADGLRINALVSLALAVGALIYLSLIFIKHDRQVPSHN